MFGNIGKDSKYLNRIKDATANMADHPRHHGIKMQAHHIISADGVKRSGLGKELAQYGYDINLLPNLVFVPCTLQGACHLKVQLHRSNHTAMVEENGNDDDNSKPINYHILVSQRVSSIRRLLVNNCPAEDPEQRKMVQREVNKIGISILDVIQKMPALAPLTSIAKSFSPSSVEGCKGLDSIPAHRKSSSTCHVDRNHYLQHGAGQNDEQIKYKKNIPYLLKAGQ